MQQRRDFLKAAPLLSVGAMASFAAPSYGEPQADDKIELKHVTPPALDAKGDFGLLGKPSPGDASVLGEERAVSLQQAKEKVTSELLRLTKERAQKDPVSDWLAIFKDQTIDERAARALLPANTRLFQTPAKDRYTYEPELYDNSLRVAGELLDRCLETRAAMSVLEISGVNAGIAYVTFLKTQLVESNLIKQSSIADLSDLQTEAQTRDKKLYERSVREADDFEKLQQIGLKYGADTRLAQAALLKEKDRQRIDLVHQQFRLRSEMQLTQFASLLTPGAATNYAERYLRLAKFLAEDLSQAYAMLFSASKYIKKLLGAQIAAHAGQSLDVELPEFGVANDVSGWVSKIMLDKNVQPDAIDALVFWCRSVMSELDVQSQYESEFTLAVPLSQLFGGEATAIVDVKAIATQAQANKNNLVIPFTLKTTHMPFSRMPQNLRVVGIGVSLLHDLEDYMPFNYTAGFEKVTIAGPGTTNPEPSDKQRGQLGAVLQVRLARYNAVVTTPEQNVSGVPYHRPNLYIPGVRILGGPSGEAEPLMSFDSGCRNVSPYGDWSIEIQRDPLLLASNPNTDLASWLNGAVLSLASSRRATSLGGHHVQTPRYSVVT